MATWKGWQTQLLRSLGLPPTKQNLQFLTAWQGHEGGSASFNPLNTTQGAAGATDYNSVHVRNYRSPQQGLEATAETFRNGHYPAILAALRSGNPTWTPEMGKNLSTWGTGSAWVGGYHSTPVPQSGGAMPPAPQPQTGASSGGSPGTDIRQLLASQLASGRQIDWLGLARQAQTAPQTSGYRTSSSQPGRSSGDYPLGVHGKIIGTPYSGSHTLYGNWESDNAVDIAAPVGTPVYAVTNGRIGSQIGPLNSSDPHLLGNRLHLSGGGNEYYYAHLSKLAVHAGQVVHAGDLLGYSGAANGVAHLHFATRTGHPLGVAGTTHGAPGAQQPQRPVTRPAPRQPQHRPPPARQGVAANLAMLAAALKGKTSLPTLDRA